MWVCEHWNCNDVELMSGVNFTSRFSVNFHAPKVFKPKLQYRKAATLTFIKKLLIK
jgi:hypothetical protein